MVAILGEVELTFEVSKCSMRSFDSREIMCRSDPKSFLRSSNFRESGG